MDWIFEPDPMDDEPMDDELELGYSAQEARRRVQDYYGTAMFGGFPAAGGDLIASDRMSDSEIIKEAKRLGLF